MCWNTEVSGAMVTAGAVGSAITYHRGDPPAIWLTFGFFSIMEALQVWGIAVQNQCGTSSNQTVTVLSYLHIAIQPFFINAFAMELVPVAVKARARNWVYGACMVSTTIMLAQLIPDAALGACLPGSPLCADKWCTVSGDWHIAWDVPYNGLVVHLENVVGIHSGFPSYMIAAFVIPLIYGAWRFVAVNFFAGPVLAAYLTTNPNEIPAIWCLFSIGILFIGLRPAVKKSVSANDWWGRSVGNHVSN